jgi:hypothetical protein
MSHAVTHVTIPVRGLKVQTLLPPAALPADLVPPEGQPAGNPVIELQLEGGSLAVRAVLNGKSVRRALKTIAEHGPDDVNVVLQGTLKGPAQPGGPLVLADAGMTATPRAKPAAPAAGAPAADAPAS